MATKTIGKTSTGVTYEIIGDGKVRKVNDFSEIKAIFEEASTEASNFMKTLYKFLKHKDDSTTIRMDKTLKTNKILVRDFELVFLDEGFRITDRKNYNKIREDFDIPCPTPREVWEFISRPKVLKADSKLEEELDKELAKKLVEIRKLKGKKEATDAVEKLKEHFNPTPKVEVSLEDLRKKAIRLIQRNKNPRKLIEKLEGVIPNRSYNVFLNKLIRRFNNGELRASKFLREVLGLTKEISFEEKPKAAPKFTGIPFFSFNEIHPIEGTDDIELASDKLGRYKVTRSEFLCRLILNSHYKVMPSLFKYLRGKQSKEAFLEEPFIRDRFEAFDVKLLKTVSVEDTIEEFMSMYSIENPLLNVYRNEVALQVGDAIKVYWHGDYTWTAGKVISISSGIEIRYVDGMIYNLAKGQLWKRV